MTADTEKTAVKATHVFTVYAKKGWCVVKYRSDDDGTTFTACGAELPTASDSHVTLYGEWVNNKTYGRQFNVSFFDELLPTSERGVVSYFRSLKVNIGKARAHEIYKKFGDRIWDVLENSPEELLSVRGINKKVMGNLMTKLRETQSLRHILNLFRGQCGITPDKAKRIISRFGDNAELVINRKPYMLCQMGGFSFQAIDEFALSNGLPETSKDRLVAATVYLFETEAAKGHVCIRRDQICSMLQKLLNRRGGTVSERLCAKAVQAAFDQKLILASNCDGEIFFYSKDRFVQEKAIAETVLGMLKQDAEVEEIEPFIQQYQEETDTILAEKQADGVRMALKNALSILTGGPGTGKTTTIKAILYVHKLVYGNAHKPLLLAPTGKAARRMSEATGYPAMTIHSAIQYYVEDAEDGGQVANDDPLDANLILVDESSMVDQLVAYLLLKKVPAEARVVFVGDPDQLPSVGAGNILLDMINSAVIPTTRLDVIYRQGDNSPIVINAHAINEGIVDLDYSNNSFRFIPCPTYEETFKYACWFYLRCVRHYGLDNTILLCPYRSKSTLNVDRFNRALQEYLNPRKAGSEVIKSHGIEFREGDRIMQMRNTEDAKNGDTGYVLRIEKQVDKDDPTEYALYAIVEFNGDGHEHTYAIDDLRNVDLAYCTTVHKSQGSEYQTVLMIISSANPVMLKRNVVYTGITRAKANVALIGEEEALRAAILNDTADIRNTLLKQRLQAGAAEKIKEAG